MNREGNAGVAAAPNAAMDEAAKKSFDFAADATKQLLTLAAGIVAITVTFQKELSPPAAARTILLCAWGLLFVSILAGIGTMLALAGSLARLASQRSSSIMEPSVRIWSVIQIAAFLFGVLFTIVFGAWALLAGPTPSAGLTVVPTPVP